MLTGLLKYPSRASGYLAEYLVVQVWAPPYRFINLMKTGDLNHTSRCSTAPALRACAGQFLSRGFMVLLRKSIP